VKELDGGTCRHLDPSLFDPVPGDELGETRAKKYCQSCPVRLDCIELALKFPNLPGIWGGLTQRERDRYQTETTSSKR